ncbi:MAG: NADH-ubiquinone oxidoreductase chain G [uncultured Solirubrobacteraceae bacterium]|uniref:NADH-quinone oxidoreductase n=1 Tax=uncultured Solirubrobacteraceae bacterium TaxID=1162706 RepID=A0A6J4SFB1_9ACTN|nr:MAG: NADH-ubiquinone oxidoreductase chain G [uncultured Solirubrobacteraceae bacterium]
MPRPSPTTITFSIDGREVEAPQNAMLVDAAKLGDVEIPVFCYEPKLGPPVGACRMCLVEIEGIPKLQTACSTPVKDGMVVHTQTQRVRAAQEHVVEFLLINHPLDCPVCDAGGECPLQDVTYGWGGGKSRFIEPKRHFKKPLELSPLVAIDRERCILCYRCVRFSQEVAEDYQLVLHERGAATYVGTFDGHPYVAPFSGNIVELCPVGALTFKPYRFRARPWDIENAGSVCTLCPAQCNIAFTVRDDRALRVLSRANPEVDDGWLCDKGRFAYQAVHAPERITAPMVRDGGVLRETSWERAIEEAAGALAKSRGRVAALAGGETTNEEGYLLQHLLRQGLDSGDLDHRAGGGLDRDALLALSDPALQATVSDLEYAHTVLVLGTEPVDDAPILDLRLRKGVRRNRMRLAVATERPSTLDPAAKLSLRYAPGGEAALVTALAAAFFGGDLDGPAGAAGADADALRELAGLLRTGGEDVVILYGERLLAGGPDVVGALLKLAGALGLSGRPGAGLLGVPTGTNARGLREVGVLPHAGPGLAPATPGRDATQIAAAAEAGDVNALYLLKTDPLRDQPHRGQWLRALDKATHIIAHAGFLTEGIREHATIVFPAESYAEKEGTVTHPDGRVQRLRPAIGRQGLTRPEWQLLAELARRCGADPQILTVHMATRRMFDEVPFYAGLTVDLLGAKGLRWWEDPARAAAFPQTGAIPQAPTGTPVAAATPNGALRLGTFRSIWAAPEVEVSPALKFLHPRQRVELSPADAQRLGVRHGDRVRVGTASAEGRTMGGVEAVAHLRDTAPAGTVFLEEGIPAHSANALEGPLVEVTP